MLNKIEVMMRLQAEVNSLVNDSWKEAGNPWYRAIWTECAEMMDHVGWKWWKKQNIDLPQVQLEVVDIWHFGLSDLIQNGVCSSEIESVFSQKIESEVGRRDIVLSVIEDFALKTLQEKKFDLKGFLKLSQCIGLDFGLLYKLYVGKNVLNRFRQDNGYKEGLYVKVWGGREDNEWLNDVVYELNDAGGDILSEIYSALKVKYSELVGE